MEEGSTLKLVFQIGSVFLPVLISLIIYIYNRQLKTIFHQINQNSKDFKELDKRVDEIDKKQGIIEERCKLNHKE